MMLVFFIGVVSGAAWLYGSAFPAFYLDFALYTDNGPMLDLGLLILLFSFLFGVAGALLTVRAGRRSLPKAPAVHLLASAAFVVSAAVFTDGPFALLEVLFASKFWVFMFGTALVFFIVHLRNRKC